MSLITISFTKESSEFFWWKFLCCYFSSSLCFPEPQSKFQLVEINICWIKGTQVCLNEVPHPYRRQKFTGPISIKLVSKHPCVKGIQVYSKEGLRLCLRGDNTKIVKFFPELQDRFQLNLAKNILGWRQFRFGQIISHAFFKVEMIMTYWRTENSLKHSKLFISKTKWPVYMSYQTRHKASLVKGMQICTKSFLKRRYLFFDFLNQNAGLIIALPKLVVENVNQVNDVAYEPLVICKMVGYSTFS